MKNTSEDNTSKSIFHCGNPVKNYQISTGPQALTAKLRGIFLHLSATFVILFREKHLSFKITEQTVKKF